MGNAFFGFGGPPKPAPGSDPWGQGIANLVGAWLQSQPTLLEQEEAKQRQALFGARADFYKTEAALKALDLQERERKQTAMQDFLSRLQAAERQENPSFVGPPNPNVTRPTPIEGLAAGFKPEDLAHVSLLTEAMKPTPDADRLRILSAAGYKPVSNNQSVNSAELSGARALDLQKEQIQAAATLGAARIRGPSGGGGDRFQIIDSQDQDGRPIKLRVNPQTGQAEPLRMDGQPVMGKRKDLTAPLQKTLGEYGDQYTPLIALKNNFKDEYAGQPMLGKVWNWAGRTFGDKGQAQFWQASDAQDMAVRNKMYGVALSVHEQRLWDATAIDPSMDPAQIRENINRRIAILEGAINRRVAAYEKGGFDREQMEMLTGLNRQPRHDAPPTAPASTGDKSVTLRQAREALAAGKDRQSIEDRLQSLGIDPKELAP